MYGTNSNTFIYYRKIIQNIKTFLSGLNTTNTHNFQTVNSNGGINRGGSASRSGSANTSNDGTFNTQNETTANDTAMVASDVIKMNNVNNTGNVNGMTYDLKHLENKTINLFNITYKYVINGDSLILLEKTIPTLLECGIIIIDTYNDNSQTAHDIFDELVQARKGIDFELICKRLYLVCLILFYNKIGYLMF